MIAHQSEVLGEIAEYYSGKIVRHGQTPEGVDWNGAESQELRFEQLCRAVNDPAQPFSASDLGCGYGAMLDYLSPRFSIESYLGVDVSRAMVDAARERHKAHPAARFLFGDRPDKTCDYCFASGIFNVRQDRTDEDWIEFMKGVIDILDSSSSKGFAFNCLTSYSDTEYMKGYLYYADPLFWFDYCKSRYARNVALLHDYGLYEFTLLVRKDTP